MRDMNASQREALRERMQQAADGEELFRDTVTVRRIGEDHAVLWEREGTICADRRGVYITGESNELTDVRELAVYSRNAIAAHCTDELVTYDLRGDERFCALKYLHLHEEAQRAINM